MIFSGVGIVKMNGKIIANFTDGTAAVDDIGAINRLKELGFKEYEPKKVAAKTESVEPVTTIKKPRRKTDEPKISKKIPKRS